MDYQETPLTQENLQLLDTYQSTLEHAQFMQSSRWASFQKERGSRIALIADENKEHIFLAIRQSLPLGYSYWYVPRCDLPKGAEAVIRKIDKKSLFVRVDILKNPDATLIRTIDVQPSTTLILKLAGPEEQILNQMHHKTRYNIRLAEKKKLTIKRGPEDAEVFLNLLAETSQRDSFRLHSAAYYKKMIESSAVELVTAWSGDDLLAGALLAYFGDTVTYVHGASSSASRQLMAPYALHWQAIKNACDAGYTWYDWHGIDEKKWPGVTRFKKGFGGEEITYAGTFDLPLAPLLYRGYTIVRRLRRLF